MFSCYCNRINYFEGEVFKSIPGYEPKYSVSNTGRVRSHKTNNESKKCQILKPFVDRDGYLKINLRGQVRKNFFIHHLVLLAFVGQCPEGKEVNHKNGIKNDNRLDNLEYVTHKQNIEHCLRTGLYPHGERNGRKTKPESFRNVQLHNYLKLNPELARGEKNPSSKLTNSQVQEIRQLYKEGGITHRQLATKYSVSKSTITAILTGVNWRYS